MATCAHLSRDQRGTRAQSYCIHVHGVPGLLPLMFHLGDCQCPVALLWKFLYVAGMSSSVVDTVHGKIDHGSPGHVKFSPKGKPVIYEARV